MDDWKSDFEKEVAKEYQGTRIEWDGDDPTLVVPEELEGKVLEIVEYTTGLWKAWGGEVKFFPEQAGHVP
jgi:hypothetical protein